MMKFKKGFTILELAMVIVLIGMIALIAFPLIDRYINNVREDMYETQINNIILAAKDWGFDNRLMLPKDNEVLELTLGELIEADYISGNIINPNTNDPFSENCLIIIKKNSQSYSYEFSER